METNRADRRRATAKVKAKRSKSYWGYDRSAERMDARRAGMVTHTAAICSCHMCGNPRKWFGQRTLKELIHQINLKEIDDALVN